MRHLYPLLANHCAGLRFDNGARAIGTMDKTGPRFFIIGAGSRGNAYADAVTRSTNGNVVGVAEPLKFKRDEFISKYIPDSVQGRLIFDEWKDFVDHVSSSKGRSTHDVDGVFVCTLDETHVEIITALAPLGVHIMSEKPLARTLEECLQIYKSLQPGPNQQTKIFSIGHVLHYSPHNMLLRKFLIEDHTIGEVMSMEHVEPVGWWHFAHSYVRGNWRRERTSAPSLLTKSCHDIDLILWLLCSGSSNSPHLPSKVASTGALNYFRRSRKPELARDATNCMTCSAQSTCIFSAKNIYEERHLLKGKLGWPLKIVDPEIEDVLRVQGQDAARQRLRARLAEDYDSITPQKEIDARPWFGRCVYESDNDVCDDQTVTITWDDDPLPDSGMSMTERLQGRGAKQATFHMIALTEAQCERRGRIYGTKGEIEYDSKVIKIFDFGSKTTKELHPPQPGGGHGGGDEGLTRHFVSAVEAVRDGVMPVDEAQQTFVGCMLDDVIRSHAMVFAAEEARKGKTVVDWKEWWTSHVEEALR